tara:strand:+ start:48 stop:584 length:537 start_codon:yes stop_codon:yes gene_type:complete
MITSTNPSLKEPIDFGEKKYARYAEVILNYSPQIESNPFIGKYYVYVYYDKNMKPYYIGKGKNSRYIEPHLSKNVDVPDKQYIKKIRKNLCEREALIIESLLIKHYGRKDIDENGILFNVRGENYFWEHLQEYCHQKRRYYEFEATTFPKDVKKYFESNEEDTLIQDICKEIESFKKV